MSIILVGGHDRMHEEYKGICAKKGHRVKVFTQLPTKFDKLIGNADRIVLFTNTVSHKMANIAIKEAKRKNIKVVRSHSSSATSLEALLNELESDLHIACRS